MLFPEECSVAGNECLMADYNANHAVRIDGLYSESATPLGTNSVPFADEFRVPYSSGTGSYQCNKLYAAHITAASTSIDLDGTLVDPLGNSFVFSVIKGVWVINRSVTAEQYVLMLGDFVNTIMQASGGGAEIIGPGGQYFRENPIDGHTVQAGTGDVITFLVSDTVLGMDVFIWGVGT